MNKEQLLDSFKRTRKYTEDLCKTLLNEDYSVQPIDFVSPPKWHLAHSTWFFEQFVLNVFMEDYKEYHPDFSFLFNSYYNNMGTRVLRPNRGNMTRPSVEEVFSYRASITAKIQKLISEREDKKLVEIIEIGIHHEQQHQELLSYDIKYILGNQPTFPKYETYLKLKEIPSIDDFVTIDEGVYIIGHQTDTFSFDNELGPHKVYLNKFSISTNLVTNREYIKFIEAGGYENFNLWHADGWEWINTHKVKAPMYWYYIEDKWTYYTYEGLAEVNLNEPVAHVSFYEAYAYAEWRGKRLPTEFEWEAASQQIEWGQLWEWTNSAYLPYPNFETAEGALGEYNGKFMINQMVLRGSSFATPQGHQRYTYRNFFQPDMRWMFSGIRLVR